MSTFNRRIEKCAVCGKESEQVCIISTNEYGARDLDGRPSEMLRSTMPHWIHECPHCGYVSENLENLPPKFEYVTPGLLESEDYKTCDGMNFKSELAARFYRRAMIVGDIAQYEEAIENLLRAAWSCDDVGETKDAVICRSRAIAYIDWLLPDRSKNGVDFDLYFLRMDLLRRIGAFDVVFTESSAALQFAEGKMLGAAVPLLEYYLSWKRDSRAFSHDDARRFAMTHMHGMKILTIESGIKAMRRDDAFEATEQFFNNLFCDDYESFEDCLAEDVEYVSDCQGCSITGKQAVWKKLMEIALSRRDATDAVPAVVSWSPEKDAESGFAEGTPCLALKYAELETVMSLALIKGNEAGQVQSIRIADVGEKEYILCPRPGWKGFRPRIIREERRFDGEGRLIDTRRTYLDDSPVED